LREEQMMDLMSHFILTQYGTELILFTKTQPLLHIINKVLVFTLGTMQLLVQQETLLVSLKQ